MRFVSQSQFSKLREFVQGAANYECGGPVTHSVDNEESYQVIRNGNPFNVLYSYCDDDGSMVYKVDESVWNAWRKQVGPIL